MSNQYIHKSREDIFHFIQYLFSVNSMAKVIHRVHSLHGQSQDITNLLQSLGVQDQDKPLLDFWSKMDT